MNIPKLDGRLKTIADFIKKDSIVVDVGTDHGYLAVYLDKAGISKKIYALDIAKKPLNQAKKTMLLYKSRNVETILSDGLNEMENKNLDEKIDTVVFAGMGGSLIGDIVFRTYWLKDKNMEIICQPMSSVENLRKNFYLNGFFIEKESLVYENEKIYTIMVVKYFGKKTSIPIFDTYTGKIFSSDNDVVNIEIYFKNILVRLKNELTGIKKADNKTKIINNKINEKENIISMLENQLAKRS